MTEGSLGSENRTTDGRPLKGLGIVAGRNTIARAGSDVIGTDAIS